MDKKTLIYYAMNVLEVARRYEEVPSALTCKFDVAFTFGGALLPKGCCPESYGTLQNRNVPGEVNLAFDVASSQIESSNSTDLTGPQANGR